MPFLFCLFLSLFLGKLFFVGYGGVGRCVAGEARGLLRRYRGMEALACCDGRLKSRVGLWLRWLLVNVGGRGGVRGMKVLHLE